MSRLPRSSDRARTPRARCPGSDAILINERRARTRSGEAPGSRSTRVRVVPQLCGCRRSLMMSRYKHAHLRALAVVAAAALAALGAGASSVLATPKVGAVANAATATAPTFGKTTVGGSRTWASPNYKFVSRFHLSEAGSVQKLSAYVFGTGSSGSQALRGVVYADASGEPGAVKASSQEVQIAYNAPRSWVDLALSAPLALPAGDYWLGFQTGPATGNALIYFTYDAVTARARTNPDDYSNGPSASFGSGTVRDRELSVNATYQAGTSTPPPTTTTPTTTTTTTTPPPTTT